MPKYLNFMSVFRKYKKLSQWDLGQELGIDKCIISDWETGKKLPPYEMRERVAEILERPVKQIFPLQGE